MEEINQFIVHHSGREDLNCFEAIQTYHKDENGWHDIGYHFVIELDGDLKHGRTLPRQGAHAYPNAGRIGVCVVGNNTIPEQRWNPSQVLTLQKLWHSIQMLWPDIGLLGHRDTAGAATECPGLDVRALLLGTSPIE